MSAGPVVVVLPAPGAVAALRRLAPVLPRDWVRAVVLVADAGAEPARVPAGVTVVPAPADGRREVAALEAALALGGAVVGLLRPDGEPEPLIVPRLAAPIVEGRAEVVLGSRALAPGGRARGPGRAALGRAEAAAASALLEVRLTEPATPWRALARCALERIPWRRAPAGRAFDLELTALALAAGLRVREVATRTAEDPAGLRDELALAGRGTAVALALAAHRRHWWRWRRLRR
jgi:hypothetical protein